MILNIERFLLMLPCKFRFDFERLENQKKFAELNETIDKLKEENNKQVVFIENLQTELLNIKELYENRLKIENKALDFFVFFWFYLKYRQHVKWKIKKFKQILKF